MANKEKFLKLVTEDPETQRRIRYREENSLWLRESKGIALKVLMALKDRDMSQKDLAELMGVSPQYVSKLVKGQENLTIETITKLQDVLGIGILATSAQRQRVKENYAYVAQ